MQGKNKSGAFYDYFPPIAGDPCDFMLKSKNYYAVDEAWWAVHAAYSEYLDKSISKEGIQESDVNRWKAVYDTYRKIVLEGLRDEYKQDFIDGKLI